MDNKSLIDSILNAPAVHQLALQYRVLRSGQMVAQVRKNRRLGRTYKHWLTRKMVQEEWDEEYTAEVPLAAAIRQKVDLKNYRIISLEVDWLMVRILYVPLEGQIGDRDGDQETGFDR